MFVEERIGRNQAEELSGYLQASKSDSTLIKPHKGFTDSTM